MTTTTTTATKTKPARRVQPTVDFMIGDFVQGLLDPMHTTGFIVSIGSIRCYHMGLPAYKVCLANGSTTLLLFNDIRLGCPREEVN